MKPLRLLNCLFVLASVLRPALVLSSPGQPADPLVDRLFYYGINGSAFEAHCAAQEKVGGLADLPARINAVAAKEPRLFYTNYAGGDYRRRLAAVVNGLLLERAGKSGEARAAFAAAGGVHAAWHLARLGDPQPLRSLPFTGSTAFEWENLVTVLIREPDAACRAKSQTLMKTLLASELKASIQVPLLCGLAEFAFQEGKLEAFTAERDGFADG